MAQVRYVILDGTEIVRSRMVADSDTVLIPKLLAHDYKEFEEIAYDSEYYESTGFNDVLVENKVTRTHTIAPKFTVAELKDLCTAGIKETGRGLIEAALRYINYYEKVNFDNPLKVSWADYITTCQTNFGLINTDLAAYTQDGQYADLIAYIRDPVAGIYSYIPVTPE